MKKIQYSKELNDYGMVEVIFYLKGKIISSMNCFADTTNNEIESDTRKFYKFLNLTEFFELEFEEINPLPKAAKSLTRSKTKVGQRIRHTKHN